MTTGGLDEIEQRARDALGHSWRNAQQRDVLAREICRDDVPVLAGEIRRLTKALDMLLVAVGALPQSEA